MTSIPASPRPRRRGRPGWRTAMPPAARPAPRRRRRACATPGPRGARRRAERARRRPRRAADRRPRRPGPRGGARSPRRGGARSRARSRPAAPARPGPCPCTSPPGARSAPPGREGVAHVLTALVDPATSAAGIEAARRLDPRGETEPVTAFVQAAATRAGSDRALVASIPVAPEPEALLRDAVLDRGRDVARSALWAASMLAPSRRPMHTAIERLDGPPAAARERPRVTRDRKSHQARPPVARALGAHRLDEGRRRSVARRGASR